MASKWYMGRKGGTVRQVFKSDATPTQESHGAQFDAVMGPFRTKRGAMFQAAFGNGNPHLQHVNDAERIAKKYA